MFTGIIEDIGTVAKLHPMGESYRIVVRCDKLPLQEVKIGDSISVNGACLTVVTKGKNTFEADISPETLQKTTFTDMKAGIQLNLERAMSASGRLDGHLVQGHVDGVGKITSHQKRGKIHLIGFTVPSALSDLMIEKGSVAIDGISLTINECTDGFFTVAIIPHTAEETTIGKKSVGDAVNIETDVIGKYVQKITGTTIKTPEKKSSIDTAFLTKTGFI